jgi:hypothetical protein
MFTLSSEACREGPASDLTSSEGRTLCRLVGREKLGLEKLKAGRGRLEPLTE